MATPLEVRPDLILLTPGDTGPWLAVEVQHDRDDDKPRRWLALAAALHDTRKHMGDLVVVTHDGPAHNFVTESPCLALVAVGLEARGNRWERPTFVGLPSQKAHEDGPFAQVAAGFSPTALPTQSALRSAAA